MADFNDFKRLAMEKANIIAGKTKIVAKGAVDKTKTAAKITKLKAEIAGEKDTIKKNYSAIGEAFYKANEENPPEGFEQLFAEVTVSYGVIQSKLDEIETLKQLAESEEFDEVIDDMKEKVGDAYDAVKNKVADVYDDIKEKLNECDDCEIEIIVEDGAAEEEAEEAEEAADEGQEAEVEISETAKEIGREVAEEIKEELTDDENE